jgi:hypothetical protein
MLHLYLGLGSDREPIACRPPKACGPCARRALAWQPPQLVLEHFKLRRWMFLSKGRLGDEARLWGEKLDNRSQLGGPGGTEGPRLGGSQLKTAQDPFRDPFHYYAHKFTVFAPAGFAAAAGRRKALERLVRQETPAHAAFQIVYVEARFQIGVRSMIGYDAVVGRYPEGVRTGEALLGRATVLSGGRGGPSLRAGLARVGTTAKLD